MVYLPACTVPEDRPAKSPRWWSYPLAVVLPFPFVVLAVPVVLLREWLGIEFLPGVQTEETMKILFLHGCQSTPSGIKPTYLRNHGHEVLNPVLPDDDFDAAAPIILNQ